MSLDPQTIVFMNIIGTMLMGVSLFIVSRGYLGQVKGLTKWALATLLQSLGWIILSVLRGKVPDIISVVGGNGLILICLGLYFTILARFINKPVRFFWIFLLIALEAIVLAYFVLITPDVAARIATISACSALLMFASSYILFANKSNRPTSHLLTAGMFTICGSILTMRCFYSLLVDTDPNQLPFGHHPMQDISYLTFFITSVMLTFCFVLMCNDKYINERKQTEEELIKAKKLAEQLVRSKDRFLSNMSHEIRTPLNGIIGFTNMLLQSELPPKQKQQIEIIKTSGNILMILINDILDLAKINEGKMILETSEFKLSDLVNDILATFELRKIEKALKINLNYDNTIPQFLIGDPFRISQILINLVNNSIKFTNNGGQLNININLLKQDEEKALVEFRITDTGIGIPKEKLDTIFEPFVQNSHNIAHKYEGTGLGLSIVKRLLNLMNGTISIKSELDEGTTVTLIIPLKITEATQIPIEKKTILLTDDLEKIGPLKILLAEDNPINQFLAQTILLQFGFSIDTVENGKLAIEYLNKSDYDIILMDLKMPEMGGLETAQYIRTQLQPPKSVIPIIAITADVTEADVNKYNKSGMNDYVLKPFDQTELLNKIINLVKKNEKKTEL